MNMVAYECGGDIIVADCGLMLPHHELMGVDLVVPDVSYLVERVGKVRGILLTHGHEDHIGGLPYILPQVPAPVYGSGLAIAFVRAKMIEFELNADLREVEPRQRVQLGAFEVEFISVTHSIPQAFCLAIRTPAGTIIHTGDYRIDTSPVSGPRFDTYSLSKCGEEGVAMLLGDSTNVERSGSTGSERVVRASLERIFADAPRQVVMASFSSAIQRVQMALEAAEETGRTVFVSGYSLERNIAIAREQGCLRYRNGLILRDTEINEVAPHRRLILTTGSQGEVRSGLSRMALGGHKRIQIDEGDTVILSARIIPGNERGIYRLINHFFRLGAQLYYERNAEVHVSGHAYRDEMNAMLSMTRPKYLMPVHGELYQLMAHRNLAIRGGMAPENIFVVENGNTVELSDGFASLGPQVEAGPILVDGKTVGEVGEVVLRDRHHLGQDGMITVILVIDQSNGKILAGPDIVSRGFVYMDESEDLIQQCKDVVLEAYNEFDEASREEMEVVQDGVRRALRRFLRKETDRFPVILPVVMEV